MLKQAAISPLVDELDRTVSEISDSHANRNLGAEILQARSLNRRARTGRGKNYRIGFLASRAARAIVGSIFCAAPKLLDLFVDLAAQSCTIRAIVLNCFPPDRVAMMQGAEVVRHWLCRCLWVA